MEFELTKEEKAFIRALKRATKHIPDRLWLFCAESGLHVMRKDEDGERVFTVHQGIDSEYIVADITDECAGGAW